jgi:hypothetical protein
MAVDMREGELAQRELHVQQEAFELGGNAFSAQVEDSAAVKEGLQEDVKEKKKAVKPLKAVSFWQLFQCADAIDILLMVVGTLGAAVNGLTLPVMLIIQGRLINTFDLIYDHIKRVRPSIPSCRIPNQIQCNCIFFFC